MAATGSKNAEKSDNKYAENLLGVVTETSGINLSDYEITSETVPVAIVGRVKVNASNENGTIKTGDYLAAGSIPGHVMLACGVTDCQAGMVIGTALEDFDLPQGQLTMQVAKFFYLPEEFGQIGDQDLSVNQNLLDSQTGLDSTISSNYSDIFTTSPNVNYGLIKTDGMVASMVQVTGLLTSGEIQVGVLSALDSKDLIIKLAESLGNSALAVFNSKGTEVFNVNTSGKVKAEEFTAEKANISSQGGSAAIGTAVMPTGTANLEIISSAVTGNSRVLVTLRSASGSPVYVDRVEQGKFIVRLNQVQVSDVKFDWMVTN